MTKAKRFICVSMPLIMNLVSLLCLLGVFLSGLGSNASVLPSLYHYKIDTTQFRRKVDSGAYMVPSNKLIDNLVAGLISAAKAKKLEDAYEIYLWGYCSSPKESASFCSTPKAQYYFDPLQAWSLGNAIPNKYAPMHVVDPMTVFMKGAKWLFVSFIIAIGMSMASILIGFLAVFSRLGPFLATLVASGAALFTFMTALTSTILFSTLVEGWSTALGPYKVSLTLGGGALALEWLAVVFSIGATISWALTTCCSAPRSKYRSRLGSNRAIGFRGLLGGNNSRADTDFKADTGYSPFKPRGYQSLSTQDQGSTTDVEAHTMGIELMDKARPVSAPSDGRDIAYEPFRHHPVNADGA